MPVQLFEALTIIDRDRVGQLLGYFFDSSLTAGRIHEARTCFAEIHRIPDTVPCSTVHCVIGV
jgi:hypothetical protein